MTESIKKRLATLTAVILLAGVIPILLIFVGSHRIDSLTNKLNATENKLTLYQDSMRITEKDYRRTILELQNINEISSVRNTDSIVLQLKEAFEEYKKEVKSGGSVTSVETNSTHTIATKPVIVYVDSSKSPTYVVNYADNWRTLNVEASADTVRTTLTTRDKYNVILGKQSNGWFKKSTPTAIVQSLSPYTQVKDMQATTITGSTTPKVTLGLQLGVGGQYGLIHKRLDFGPQVGVGVNIKF